MNKTAKHEVTDHGIKRFNQFFAEVFKVVIQSFSDLYTTILQY